MNRQKKAERTAIKIAKAMARELGEKTRNINLEQADDIRELYSQVYGNDRLTRRYDLVSIVAWKMFCDLYNN